MFTTPTPSSCRNGIDHRSPTATADSRRVEHAARPDDGSERNQWALTGNWTIGRGASVLNEAGGRLVFRFHARDVNLVMGPPEGGSSIPFRVTVDGEPPDDAHGLDVDAGGNGKARPTAAPPTDPRAAIDHRPHVRNHLLRLGRPGLLLHVRLARGARPPALRKQVATTAHVLSHLIGAIEPKIPPHPRP
jgi:Thioredoxin like C-terminal domain